MALSKLDSLYMVVADHSKHPHHQGQIEDVDQIQPQQLTQRCDPVKCEILMRMTG